ncbi:hypothetical protein [Marinobacter aromaticivorans]|uniref:Tetratricopeptide repeat protein n=1 Tax=Marinobacter aromaticivorans TaxID=1494078 RepID=A0ABW2IWK8_9GAMM|nr:hypothetical protein [Marinobacter aromaticivorans]
MGQLLLNRAALAVISLVASALMATITYADAPAPNALRAGLEQFALAASGWNTSGTGVLGQRRKPRQQALYEEAESARTGGDFEQAGKVLAGMDEGYWSALGYLNLSSAYARNDLNPSRALVALRVALAMAEKDPHSRRKTALRSRILLRAGYLAYTNSEYEKAIGFLERIPLDSHKTPQALYFHGLALSQQGNHRAAMQSWHRAKKYPLAYPGVAESWLGMGRGYDLSGYLGQAGEAYLAANGAYESERVTLRKLASQVEDQGAYTALVLNSQGLGNRSADWFLADSRTLSQPRTAYLLQFMEQPAGQKAVDRVADLSQMAVTLERNIADLDVFIAAISGQLELPAVVQPATEAETLKAGIAVLEARLSGLRERASGKAMTPDQRLQLNAMKTTLSDLQQQLDRFPARVTDRNGRLEQLLARARQLRQKSQVHLESVAALQIQAEDALDSLALEFLAGQDRRMVFALDKTEQQIAHLYEYLALQGLDSGEHGK